MFDIKQKTVFRISGKCLMLNISLRTLMLRMKNEMSAFQFPEGMIILSQEKRVIFKSEFQDVISKQRSVKWKWFFNRNPKNVA